MEELEYFLKEWLDSYIVSKELTFNRIDKTIENGFVKYEWENREESAIAVGGFQMRYKVRNFIVITVNDVYLNFDLLVNLEEYPFLMDLDKIITGYSRFIKNHKRQDSYDYSFQLVTRSDEHAKNLIKRLFE